MRHNEAWFQPKRQICSLLSVLRLEMKVGLKQLFGYDEFKSLGGGI